ncbi:unnamed protein product [uncultured bacterium]|nr:unnamed protein product [uncultured bacterium]
MSDTRREFCTYFDQAYLSRGLALYDSLRRHCPDFRLWVLCLDEATHAALRGLALPHLVPIASTEFERDDQALQEAKANRSRREYYFTCTPSLLLFLLHRDATIDTITYLDADLFFFANPQPVFDEIAASAIAIVPHRFPRANRQFERYGIFNVGWLTFRRSAAALACLAWWRERCLEWCFDREDPARYADQKYLDDWPTRFEGVHIVGHKGANLASWNLANYAVSHRDGMVFVDDEPLIFFHFHHLKPRRAWLFETDFGAHGARLSRVVKEHVLTPYLRCLGRQSAAPFRSLRTTVGDAVAGNLLLYVGGRVL